MRDSQGHLRAGEVLKDEEETQPSFQGVEVDLHSQGEPFSGYFNVRLTSMLLRAQESLCGNSKTVMMAAISPNFLDFEPGTKRALNVGPQTDVKICGVGNPSGPFEHKPM